VRVTVDLILYISQAAAQGIATEALRPRVSPTDREGIETSISSPDAGLPSQPEITSE
jgi:hypothetical protein